MESIRQMRERHKREIEELRSVCKHEEHHRVVHEWALRHPEEVEACDRCDKILKNYPAQEE